MEREPERKPETPIEVYIYLVVGVLMGFALLIHPLIFVSWWWNPLMDALREGQRTDVWKPALVMLSVLAGLAALFGFLQPARQYERSDPFLRHELTFGN